MHVCQTDDGGSCLFLEMRKEAQCVSMAEFATVCSLSINKFRYYEEQVERCVKHHDTQLLLCEDDTVQVSSHRKTLSSVCEAVICRVRSHACSCSTDMP